MTEVVDPSERPPGAVLNEAQVRKLKIAIAVMTAMLVVGLVALFARIIYLASGRGDAGAQRGAAQPSAVLADVKLPLPSGARLSATSLQGSRLVAQYAAPTGDGIVIVDLATGRVVSHVKVETRP